MKEFVFIPQENGAIFMATYSEHTKGYHIGLDTKYPAPIESISKKAIFVSREELEGFLEDVKKVQQCKHESAPVIDPLAPKGVTKGICWDCGKEVEVKEDKS